MIHDFTNEDIDWGEDVKSSQNQVKRATKTMKRPNKYDYKSYFDSLQRAARAKIIDYDTVIDIIKDTCFMYIDAFEQATNNINDTYNYVCGNDADKQNENKDITKEAE